MGQALPAVRSKEDAVKIKSQYWREIQRSKAYVSEVDKDIKRINLPLKWYWYAGSCFLLVAALPLGVVAWGVVIYKLVNRPKTESEMYARYFKNKKNQGKAVKYEDAKYEISEIESRYELALPAANRLLPDITFEQAIKIEYYLSTGRAVTYQQAINLYDRQIENERQYQQQDRSLDLQRERNQLARDSNDLRRERNNIQRENLNEWKRRRHY